MLDKNKRIIENLINVCNERGWSESELARQIGIRPQHWSDLKFGKKGIGQKTLKRIEDRFGVDFDSNTGHINDEWQQIANHWKEHAFYWRERALRAEKAINRKNAWKHRFNSKPTPPVEIDTKGTGKTVRFYSEGKEEISI